MGKDLPKTLMSDEWSTVASSSEDAMMVTPETEVGAGAGAGAAVTSLVSSTRAVAAATVGSAVRPTETVAGLLLAVPIAMFNRKIEGQSVEDGDDRIDKDHT